MESHDHWSFPSTHDIPLTAVAMPVDRTQNLVDQVSARFHELPSIDESSSIRAPSTGNEASPADLWRALAAGRLGIVGEFESDGHSCLVACKRRAAQHARHALSNRDRILLQEALRGRAQKLLATDFDLPVTQVSGRLGRSLHKMGLCRRVGKTPLPLVLCVLHDSRVIDLPARLAWVEDAGQRHVVLSVPRLSAAVLPGLSEGERRVALRLAAGESYREIADRHGRSPYTVGNQIAAVFEKLGVHGRFELVALWAKLTWTRPRSAG